MNYVEKAKQLLKKTALHGAMVILPLAAVESAQAISIAPTMPSSCPSGCAISVQQGNSSGGQYGTAQLLESNGIVGIKFFTIEPVFGTFTSGSQLAQFEMTSSGTLTGGNIASGTNIPISFIFNWNLGTPETPLIASEFAPFWEVSIEMRQFGSRELEQPSATASYFCSGSGVDDITSSGCPEFTTTSGTFNQDLDLEILLTLTLSIESFPEAPIDFYFDIPQDSVDINAVPTAGIPEPATVALTLAGLGTLLLRRSSRR
jgi:hypothetical protein